MQSKLRSNDTIAAIATPAGTGAIGVIRLSGDDAIEIVARFFRGNANLADAKGNTVHYGRIAISGGETIDEVLATVFRAPHSYTGEDVVEVGCHGGAIVAPRLLDLFLKGGARIADPGEFTRRAFMNNRIDLTQAEAVAELISSRSKMAQQQSVCHLQGGMKEKAGNLKDQLIQISSLLEIDLDFSEEGIDLVSLDLIIEKLREVLAEVISLEKTFETGRILREGVRVAIVGPPNVGKSSLFNALLAFERSIVSEEPGTTRDFLEESISISGVLFSLVDTAGQREATSSVESEGVRRSIELTRSSDLVLAVADASGISGGQIPDEWLNIGRPEKVLAVLNKADLCNGPPPKLDTRSVRQVATSARTGEGLDQLRSELVSMALGSTTQDDVGLVVTNRRHADVLARARQALQRSLDSAQARVSNEFIALDTREAVSIISEITGEVTSEDILNAIFAQFCVGK